MIAYIQKHKRAVIITSIALALLLMAFAAFIVYSIRVAGDLFKSDKVTPTATQYSEWVGLWLPADVQNFQAYGEGWQDWLVEARFEMSTSELTEFLERNTLQPSDLEISLESNYKLEWFSSKARLEVYQLGPLPNQAASTSTGFYPTFWIDQTNSGTVIVYIKANDT
jgi:hypothetical protein